MPISLSPEQASAILLRLQEEYGEFVLHDLVAAGFRADVASGHADPETPSEWLLAFEV